MKAYHFINPSLKTRFDGIQAVVGETLKVDPSKVELCTYGLHASVHPMDALNHAQSDQTTLCLVELGGKILEGKDKVVASERTILKCIDATRILRKLALFCAEFVLHIYEKEYPSDTRVRECIDTVRAYLEGKATEEDLKRAETATETAARAAWDAAWAAWAAARAAWAAWAATREAAGEEMIQKICNEFQRLVDEEMGE